MSEDKCVYCGSFITIDNTPDYRYATAIPTCGDCIEEADLDDLSINVQDEVVTEKVVDLLDYKYRNYEE